MSSQWMAAAAVAAVTPPPGLPMGGYSARTDVSTGTLDELEVNILTLRGPDGTRLAWIAIDALAVTAPLRAVLTSAAAVASGMNERHIVVLASHTHSAPAGWSGEILPSLPARIDPELLRSLSDAVSEVALTEMPVTVEFAMTAVPGVAANRERIDGPTDPGASVLAVYDAERRPLALFYDFACHPTVLGPENLQWSADWPGAARRALRESLGADLAVVFAQGASGDVSTRFLRQGRGPAEVERTGRSVAAQLLAALPQARSLVSATLRIERSEAALPSRWTGGSDVAVPLSVARVGGLRLLAIPGELVAGLGMRLTDGHADVRLHCCADGYLGYLADEESHADGRYEAASSPFTLEDTLALLGICEHLVAAS